MERAGATSEGCFPRSGLPTSSAQRGRDVASAVENSLCGISDARERWRWSVQANAHGVKKIKERVEGGGP